MKATTILLSVIAVAVVIITAIIVYQFYQQEQAKQFVRDAIAKVEADEEQQRIDELSANVNQQKVNDCMKNITKGTRPAGSKELLFCSEGVYQADLQTTLDKERAEQEEKSRIVYACLAEYGYSSMIGVSEDILNKCAKA